MELKVPKSALTFSEDLSVNFSATDDIKYASMLGYSGKPMEHWLFGKLVVDVEGIDFNKPRIPILEDHDHRKKIGWSQKPNTANHQVNFENIRLLSNDTAENFHANATEGFPYQASISFYPKKIEELTQNAKAKVNGYEVQGPALIFRESIFRESSVVTFGMDHRTHSKPLSDEEKVAVNFSEADAEIIQKFLQPTKETDMEKDTSKDLELKIQEYEAKIAALETSNTEKFTEYENQIKLMREENAKVRQENFKKDVETKLGADETEFIMKFYGKLENEELGELIGKIQSYTEKINALGAPQGDSDVPEEKKEASFDEVKKYAEEKGVSFSEANRALNAKN